MRNAMDGWQVATNAMTSNGYGHAATHALAVTVPNLLGDDVAQLVGVVPVYLRTCMAASLNTTEHKVYLNRIRTSRSSLETVEALHMVADSFHETRSQTEDGGRS